MKIIESSKVCLGSFIFVVSLFLVGTPFTYGNSPARQENSQAQTTAPVDNPPARAARISYLKGKVSFQPAGHDQWSEATLNFTVTTGDRIYTDKDARAELEVGPYTARLSDNTDLTITNLNDQIMQLGLEQGTLRVSIYQLPSGNTVEVDTPNALSLFSNPVRTGPT